MNLPTHSPPATEAEAGESLQLRARTLADAEIAPRAAQVDRDERYPWENVSALTREGFMGMTSPRQYGGLGASYLDAAIVIEEMARVCGVTGRIAVEANMGA
ncbi:MAG: acyl-CoA dehydrogenase family protein, partial [Acidiferrobacterales bacterium]|nr:acyl-CoA dehydrogenase family protein [Acidiferrobacterales bacterium]